MVGSDLQLARSNPATAPGSFVVFSLRGALYAVDATSVREAVWLPELTPLAETPPYVAGLANVRGRVVPVMDLALRLGMPPRAYRLSDSVVLLEDERGAVGLLVDEVCEVRTLDATDLESVPTYGGTPGGASTFVIGVAKVEESLIALLDLELVLRRPGQVPALPSGEPAAEASPAQGFSPSLSAADREVFRRRATQLRKTAVSEDLVGLVPLAVVGLAGEYYGLELDAIREFTRIGDVTPVPCCPAHIAGNVNLRGEILTLVDIRRVLGLELEDSRAGNCAVVVEVEDLRVGVLVDDVFDVAYVHPDHLTAIPTALKSGGDEYLKGTARRGEKTLGVLDLAGIFRREDLLVDEEP